MTTETKNRLGNGWRILGWRILGWGTAGAILLLPAIAMQFTREVVWGPLDFVVAGALLGGIGLAFEFAARKSGNWFYRGGAALALGNTLFMIWSEMAVGIIGDEGNPANLMFAGVLAVALGGAILARFEARRMARAMLAAAGAQLLVAAIAILGHMDYPAAVTAIFVGLWLGSAWLFRKAA